MKYERKHPVKVAVISLGCPKALVDSERMTAILAEGGCLVGAPVAESDVVVVNTCGFISAAREESMEVIKEAIEHKRSGNVRRVVVAGCLVNRDAQRLYDAAPGIDAVVGINDRQRILQAVTAERRYTKISPCAPGGRGVCDDRGRFRLTPRHTAYLRIAEGCGRRCTFCTIPAIRGPFRSKTPHNVLAEAEELIADGAVELNVIAQDTTSYGSDLGKEVDTASLFRLLNELPGARWIRLMYAYPNRFTDALINAIDECEHVVPYIDLPLQHISDDILRMMGRGVGRKAIEKLLEKIRGRIPGVAIRTTFIVGFPGETHEHFEELLTFVKDFSFEAMGAFEYSPEEGTPAADMPDQVADEVKAARAEELMLAQQEIAFAKNADMVGRKVDVLIDGPDKDGYLVGRYYGQAPEVDSVCFIAESDPPAELPQPGGFIKGEVIDYDGYDLIVAPIN